MKRYETFLDKHCGQPFANIEEDANGGLVMYDEAQAEIDRLKAENAELLAALEWSDGEDAPKDGSEFFIYYGEPTIARWQPDGSDFPWIFLDSQDGKFIFNRLKSLKDVGWKPISVLKAIANARGESV